MQLITLLASASVLGSAASCPMGHSESRKLDAASPVVSFPIGSPATKDCSAKHPFDIDTIYGGPTKALSCMNTAVSILKANWNKEVVGPCLRASFHDCGTYASQAVQNFGKGASCGGCNGSFKQEYEAGMKDGFASFPEQNGMQLCYDFLFGTTNVAAKIKKTGDCMKMTNADIISLTGLVAVAQSGGSPQGGCNWYPGRPDAPSTSYDNTDLLPGEGLNGAELISTFGSYDFYGVAKDKFGLDQPTLLALMNSAHTVGKTRAHDKSDVNQGLGSMSGTPDLFDGGYFSEVLSVNGLKGMMGWFASDRHGLCNVLSNPGQELSKRRCTDANSPLKPAYQKYSDLYMKGNDEPFRADFCKAFQAMSTIGLTVPSDIVVKSSPFVVR